MVGVVKSLETKEALIEDPLADESSSMNTGVWETAHDREDVIGHGILAGSIAC
jgi:hypothetical protein